MVTGAPIKMILNSQGINQQKLPRIRKALRYRNTTGKKKKTRSCKI